MSVYMKRFVYMSLFYLGLAAVFGMLSGTMDIGYAGTFAHTHFNLLGFMAMIVFGIGYFILPRFNGAELRWPGWVPVHFWLGNISLVGMVLFRGLYSITGGDHWQALFVIASTAQVVSLFLFIVNIGVSLSARKQPEKTTETVPTKPEPVIDSETKIAELVDQAPSVREVLVEQGLKMLAVPGHLDKVRKVGVTLSMAAANHGLEVETLVQAVKAEVKRSMAGGSPTAEPKSPETVDINSETLIGAVVHRYPQTQAVFARYFGDGCLDCPGQSYESIDLACRMHGVDPAMFLAEVQSAAADRL